MKSTPNQAERSRKMDRIAKIWDYILESGIATEAELKLVTNINGYNEEALNSIIYARTAYHDMEQLQ